MSRRSVGRAFVVILATLGLVSTSFFVPVADLSKAKATPVSKPNIVLIVSDDQGFDSLAAMPFLTSKPGGHWFEFPHAFEATPLCCPSRSSILTGLYSHHHGVQGNNGGPFNDSSTLATWLQRAGYRTGMDGKYLNEYPFGKPLFIPPGWSDFFAMIGESGNYGYSMYDNGTVVPYGSAPADYQTDVVARRADSFIRSAAPTGQPFFLYATPIAPHAPLIPPPRYAKAPVTVTRPPNFNEADVSDKPAWIKALPLMTPNQATAMDKERVKEFRMVMALDDVVRTVYTALSDTGTLDNSIIVFMTDNSVMYGEHRATDKSCVYEECVHTPMFVRVPWLNGRVEPGLVQNIDLAPTFAELAGIVPPDPVDGLSMVPFLNDAGASWRSSGFIEFAKPDTRPTFTAIRTQQWKYVELDTGERELYDMVGDPYELVNVAGQPSLAGIQASLATQLAALRTAPAHKVLPSASIADASVTEGTGGTTNLQFDLSLSIASLDPVTVRASTSNGSATAPSDYQSTVQQVTFAPGTTNKTLTVPVQADVAAEPDESFQVTLDQPQGLAVADGQATGLILNDDDLVGLSVDDVAVTEGNSGVTPATFTVSLSQASAGPVTVSYATVDGSAISPADYESKSGVLTFDPGDTARSVTVNVVGEDDQEGDETFSLVLSDPNGALLTDATGAGTILTDDPLSKVSIGDSTVTEGNSGTAAGTFTVTMSPSSTQSVNVSWATADGTALAPGDYAAASNTLTFAPGETSKSIVVNVAGDSKYEANETYSVDLTATDVEIADGHGVGTITNDDSPPSIAISDVTMFEGNSGTTPANFAVTLSAASGLPVTVNYASANGSAKTPSDYLSKSGSVTFAPGETSKTIAVSIVGDTASEKTESFKVNLSSSVGATIADPMGNCTIKNDDG